MDWTGLPVCTLNETAVGKEDEEEKEEEEEEDEEVGRPVPSPLSGTSETLQTGPTREEGLLLPLSVRNKEEEGRENLGEWPPKGGDAEAGAALGEKAGSGSPRNGRV